MANQKPINISSMNLGINSPLSSELDKHVNNTKFCNANRKNKHTMRASNKIFEFEAFENT